MDIYKLKFTTLQLEIIRFLCMNAGKQFTGRSISRSLGVSPTAISKSLPALKKESLVIAEKDKESGRMSIGLNSENPKAIYLKRAENLRLIYESGLADFLSEKFPKSRITLTGEFSKGADRKDSPIEISVESPEKSAPLPKFEKILGKKIILNFYPANKMSKQVEEPILEGISLFGGSIK